MVVIALQLEGEHTDTDTHHRQRQFLRNQAYVHLMMYVLAFQGPSHFTTMTYLTKYSSFKQLNLTTAINM